MPIVKQSLKKHGHGPQTASKVAIGDLMARKSSPTKVPKKSGEIKKTKSILKTRRHDTTTGCNHTRRISFVSVQHDDSSAWDMGNNVQLDSGLDPLDMLTSGIISEEEYNLISSYKGFCPFFRPMVATKSKKNEISLVLPTVNLTKTKCERTFFDKFVMNRIPAKLVGQVQGSMWAMEPDVEDSTFKWGNLEYLKRVAGSRTVMIERAPKDDAAKTKKHHKKHIFGHGRREPIQFSEFIDLYANCLTILSCLLGYHLMTKLFIYLHSPPAVVYSPSL